MPFFSVHGWWAKDNFFPYVYPLLISAFDWFMAEWLYVQLIMIEYHCILFIISLCEQLNTLYVFNISFAFLDGILFSMILMIVPISLIGKILVLLICEWQRLIYILIAFITVLALHFTYSLTIFIVMHTSHFTLCFFLDHILTASITVLALWFTYTLTFYTVILTSHFTLRFLGG